MLRLVMEFPVDEHRVFSAQIAPPQLPHVVHRRFQVNDVIEVVVEPVDRETQRVAVEVVLRQQRVDFLRRWNQLRYGAACVADVYHVEGNIDRHSYTRGEKKQVDESVK